ncbi:MAG TPA: histidine kinase, partial [Candidatus Eisenbacteria bacterium]|nr:histidine kinase [Candidatus Eisenbacteria bacterium]
TMGAAPVARVDYSHLMHAPALALKPRGRALVFGWRRVRFTLLLSLLLGVLFSFRWGPLGIVRISVLGLFGLLAFGLLEQWPKRLPSRLARWVLQVIGVALAMPIGTLLFPVFGVEPSWEVQGLGLLVAPWAALAALVRQKDALARHQALAFDLERSELEREALDARLRLLQAQVAPHFLFNTLANVQALVDAGSPRASEVLQSLIAYLRAAVPRLDEPAATVDQELQLVRAYLELMHMRMPDRLQFSLHVDETALALQCPPMTLLTLVENAVRHGIDPSEEGGRIDIHVHRRDNRCVVRVSDTGMGLQQGGNGLGTGLSTLRERLRLAFGGDAELRVSAQRPRGVCAELDLPAREASP